MSSYLSVRVRLPLEREAVHRILARPFVPPSPALRAMLDELLLPLCRAELYGVVHHPDEHWIDAHLDFFGGLSGWDVLGLIAERHRNFPPLGWVAGPSPQAGPAGYLRQGHELTYLAFAYADAALAERLAAALPAGSAGLLSLDAGSQRSLHLMLTSDSMQRLPAVYWYDQHPLHRWLAADSWDFEPWPEWEAVEAAMRDGTAPAADRWLAFVAEQRRALVNRASVSTPLRLNECHFTDGKLVFYGYHGTDDATLLEGCDPLTFTAHADGEGMGRYATDARGLWNRGRRLPCEHPQAFGPLPGHGFFFTDGRYVYSEDEALPDVVASDIRPVPGDGFLNGFLWGDSFYTRYVRWDSYAVDTASFRALSYDHFVDAEGVCLLDQGELLIVEGFDPASVRLLEHGDSRYLCDAVKVGVIRANNAQPKLLKGAEAATFRGVARLPFVSDGRRVWLGDKPCKELHGDRLRLPRILPEMPDKHGYCSGDGMLAYFRHGDAIGYVSEDRYHWLADADADSFEILHAPLARDAARVWHWGKPVAGARAAGFAWLDAERRLWTDGERYFEDGEEIPRADGVGKNLGRGMVLADGAYRFVGRPVSGWSARTHRPAAIGGIEDDAHYYTWRNSEGNPLLAWSKAWCAEPLNHYRLDGEGIAWVPETLAPVLPPAATPVLGPEEFDALVRCLPPSMSRGITTTFSQPSATIVRTGKPCACVEITDPVQYRMLRLKPDGPLDETLKPRTRNARAMARQVLERLLEETPPLSFAELDELVARVPAGESWAEFGGERSSLQLQDGRDNLRGAWLSLDVGGGEMLRLECWVDEDGFLAASCYKALLDQWNASSVDGRFFVLPWSAELRAQWRDAMAAFLVAVPAASRGKAASKKAPPLKKPEISRLVGCLAPKLGKTDGEAMAAAIFLAQQADPDPDLDGTHWAEPGAMAWEVLLEHLEQHGLLHGFDKQQPLLAGPACNALAQQAGLAETFAQSDASGNDSFWDVAADFDRWLAPRGHTLLWPQASLQWDGDELFPAIVVASTAIDEIDALVSKLGGAARFMRTD